MKEYQPIACQRYDYIEIACMHHYQLTVELLDGTVIQGQAINTKIENKQEFLLLDVSSKKRRFHHTSTIGSHPSINSDNT